MKNYNNLFCLMISSALTAMVYAANVPPSDKTIEGIRIQMGGTTNAKLCVVAMNGRLSVEECSDGDYAGLVRQTWRWDTNDILFNLSNTCLENSPKSILKVSERCDINGLLTDLKRVNVGDVVILGNVSRFMWERIRLPIRLTEGSGTPFKIRSRLDTDNGKCLNYTPSGEFKLGACNTERSTFFELRGITIKYIYNYVDQNGNPINFKDGCYHVPPPINPFLPQPKNGGNPAGSSTPVGGTPPSSGGGTPSGSWAAQMLAEHQRRHPGMVWSNDLQIDAQQCADGYQGFLRNHTQDNEYLAFVAGGGQGAEYFGHVCPLAPNGFRGFRTLGESIAKGATAANDILTMWFDNEIHGGLPRCDEPNPNFHSSDPNLTNGHAMNVKCNTHVGCAISTVSFPSGSPFAVCRYGNN